MNGSHVGRVYTRSVSASVDLAPWFRARNASDPSSPPFAPSPGCVCKQQQKPSKSHENFPESRQTCHLRFYVQH